MENPTKSPLFRNIRSAVLDLQASDLQSYSRPIKLLARLIQDKALDAINNELTAGLNLDHFLQESEKTQGGMVGSANLVWPDDPKKFLGLSWLLICSFGEDPNKMLQIGHRYFYGGSKIISTIHNVTRQLVIPFARDYEAYVNSKFPPEVNDAATMNRKIFIVHGHDGEARETVSRFLQTLGFMPIILHEQANKGRTIIEKVEAQGDVDFAVVLLTPDDIGHAKDGVPEPRARQNVIIELGYFLGKLGRDRVCTLKRGHLEIPSDFAGVVWEEMDSGNGWKLSLARELKAAGHDVDLNKVLP